MSEQTAAQSTAMLNLAGKYLAFELASEEYGIDILKIREIIGMADITRVPRMPSFVKGVVNLRGRVIPVMDLRVRLGMPAAEDTPRTCIIVIEVNDIEMGVIVDSVLEVITFPAEKIQETPSFGPDIDSRFILGIGDQDGRPTLLLDVEQVLGNQARALADNQMADNNESTNKTK